MLKIVSLAALFHASCANRAAGGHHHGHHHKHPTHKTSKIDIDSVPPTPEEQSIADAHNAREAAISAKAAASVASKVAAHSVGVSQKAQEALGNARDALNLARADASALTKEQEEALHKAEGKLVVTNELKVEVDTKRAELQAKLKVANTKSVSDLKSMRSDIREMREELARKKAAGNAGEDDKEVDDELKALEGMMKALEAEEAKTKHVSATTHDALQGQIDRLRPLILKDGSQITQEDKTKLSYDLPAGKATHATLTYELPAKQASFQQVATHPETEASEKVAGIDIDTAMPYGELEPFGREDTAQELTESSVHESDAMVDQLERAEVAEEKRAVFRALTRLRGAAITSFDGVARSQTGNIDEYNKVHQWRNTHPLHHLADEESDISKWAFPDNADF